MISELFKVKLIDVLRSAIFAVGLSILALLYGMVIATGFDVFNTDWVEVGKMCINTAFISFISTLAATFLTDQNGKLGGKI